MSLIDGIDDNDPRLRSAMSSLQFVVKQFLGRDLDAAELIRLGEALAWHRKHVLQKFGISFPVLTALVIPRLGQIKLVRADLPTAEIEILIVNLAVEFGEQEITVQEIAWAVRHAFPKYKPRDWMAGLEIKQ